MPGGRRAGSQAEPARAPDVPAPSGAPPGGAEGARLDAEAWARLRAGVGDDPEFLAELVSAFLEDAPPLLAALRIAVTEGDAQGVRQAAHPLKSNSRDFGAARLADLLAELEEAGRGGDLEGAADRVEVVVAEWQRVRIALLERVPDVTKSAPAGHDEELHHA